MNFPIEHLMRIRYNRKKSGSPTLYSQPGAHTGATRQYIPGYSASNIVFLNTSTGNDGNSGADIANAKLTYASAATAAGSTKKIRLVNSTTLTDNITKPTEATIGTTSTIKSSSLTAPVDTWTQAGTPSFSASAIYCVTWVPWLSKYVAGGASGKLATSPDGNVWTQVVTSNLSTAVHDICISRDTILAISADDSVTSTDGVTWTRATAPKSNLYGVAFSESLNLFVAVGLLNQIYYAADGSEWRASTSTVSSDWVGASWSSTLAMFVAVGTDNAAATAKIAYSLDGSTWADAGTITGADSLSGCCWSERLGKLFAVGADGGTGAILFSTNGTAWTAAATPSFGSDGVYSIIDCLEIEKLVACGINGKIAYSTDGDTFTQSGTPSFGASEVFDIAYSPLYEKFAIVGDAGKIAYSTAYATTISASVAGFSIQAVQYSGTPTAYNCTLKQPGTTAGLNLNACRVTESGAHISNDEQAHLGTLFEGDFHITCTPAAANDLDINCNTITGTLYIYNASSTLYERIRDNIIEGGIRASYAVLVQSGNLRGTSVNATLSSKVTNGQDPVFHDTTDYKLKRITSGDSQDSPLVNAALYYINEAGEDRDVGAWSYDDTANALDFENTFYILKPSAQGFVPSTVPAANAYQGDSGEWDSYNNPSRYSDYLTIRYQNNVPVDHIEFQDRLEALDDMTVEISPFPEQDSPSSDITVNGAHSVGDVVLNIDASTTFKSGMHFTTGGNTYYAIYCLPVGNVTKIILNRALVAAIADNTVITPADVSGWGEYQYLPQSRENPNPLAQEQDFVGGVLFRFVRKKT